MKHRSWLTLVGALALPVSTTLAQSQEPAKPAAAAPESTPAQPQPAATASAPKITPLTVASVTPALAEPVTPSATAGLFDGKLELKGKRFYIAEFRVL